MSLDVPFSQIQPQHLQIIAQGCKHHKHFHIQRYHVKELSACFTLLHCCASRREALMMTKNLFLRSPSKLRAANFNLSKMRRMRNNRKNFRFVNHETKLSFIPQIHSQLVAKSQCEARFSANCDCLTTCEDKKCSQVDRFMNSSHKSPILLKITPRNLFAIVVKSDTKRIYSILRAHFSGIERQLNKVARNEFNKNDEVVKDEFHNSAVSEAGRAKRKSENKHYKLIMGSKRKSH